MNLYGDFLQSWAARRNEAMLFADDATLCFAELDNRAAALAGAMRDGLSVAPGDVVLAAVGKSVEAVACYLACLRAGIVFLPMNPASTARELAHVIADARPRLVLTDPAIAATASAAIRSACPDAPPARLTLAVDGNGPLADEARRCRPFSGVEACSDGATAALLYTSGTTGTPKGVPLSHGNLASNARALVQSWALDGGDVLAHALPIFHVHGLFVGLNCALLAGMGLRFLAAFDADRLAAALAHSTVLMGVPTYYGRLLASTGFARHQTTRLRLAISGSAPLPEKLFHAFEARTGHRILERYGMTETGMIASNPLRGERLPGTVGYPLPGVRVRIEDARGQPAPAGTPGVVQVRGPGVFAGYLNRPDATAEAFTRDGWFRTGDIGRLAADGRLTLHGRAGDLIISGGYNLYPAEIEACLDTLQGVAESAVVGAPDDDLGEVAIAVIVPDDPARPPREEDLRRGLVPLLARYKQPRRFAFVSHLPRNTMGKVLKQTLRNRFGGRADGD